MLRFPVAILVLVFGVAGVFFVYVQNEPVSHEVATTTTTMRATTPAAAEPLPSIIPSVLVTTAKDEIQDEHEWKHATATVFWVGEEAEQDNGYIHNRASAWDGEWQTHFGGVDEPNERCDYLPCVFTPAENPFYVALPYNDRDEQGRVKTNASRIPWYYEARTSILKNRWIAVRSQHATCYAQWEDVGPFHADDVEYVFGDAEEPLNQIGSKAGIDLSPAMRDCLDMDGLASVEWRHVEAADVPEGAWHMIVTKN